MKEPFMFEPWPFEAEYEFWNETGELNPEFLEEEWEGENNGNTPPGPTLTAAPRVLTYTTNEVIDNRISVPAQHSLVRLSKNPATSADAVAMLQEIKAGRLAGIYCVNWEKSAQRALRLGSNWWSVIPQGEDAVLMLDPDNLSAGVPLIAFRRDLAPDCGLLAGEGRFSASPSRLDAALIRVWQIYLHYRQGIIQPCAATSNGRTSVSFQAKQGGSIPATMPALCQNAVNLILYASGFPPPQGRGRLDNRDFSLVAARSRVTPKVPVAIANIWQLLDHLLRMPIGSIDKLYLLGHGVELQDTRHTPLGLLRLSFGRTGDQLDNFTLNNPAVINFISTNQLWNRFREGARIIVVACGHEQPLNVLALLDSLGNRFRVCVEGFGQSLCIFRPGRQIGIRPSTSRPCPQQPTGDLLEQLSTNLSSCSCPWPDIRCTKL